MTVQAKAHDMHVKTLTRWNSWPASLAALTMFNPLMAVSSAHLSVQLHADLREVAVSMPCVGIGNPYLNIPVSA